MKIDNEQPAANHSRLLQTPIGWYALTRENYDLGPFPTRQAAATALERHILVYRGINERPTEPWAPQLHVHDSTSCGKQNCGRCVEASSVLLFTIKAS